MKDVVLPNLEKYTQQNTIKQKQPKRNGNSYGGGCLGKQIYPG